MVELPKTEQELQDLIDKAVSAKVDELTAKHNNDMAGVRKSYEDKIKKAQDQANMSVEEKAQQLAKEKEEATQQELTELRAYKKTSVLKERLAKENLPSYFANDNRLLSAEDGELDKAIKTVKGEYEASLPKGNTHSSVVQVTGNATNPNGGGDNKDKAYNSLGGVLKNVLGDK